MSLGVGAENIKIVDLGDAVKVELEMDYRSSNRVVAIPGGL